jgi:hypothetical protein
MNIILFTGPSLSPNAVAKVLDAKCLPPVSQGDVYRATQEEPDVIGIVDGYFRSVPSVWHKEILWALSRGIRVYGSASMGALRAAELVPFGMIGVGWVYEAFRDGLLIDDDEVAVEHGPAELDYACTSEAMVNIRRTLTAAERDHVICRDTLLELERIAKSAFYPNRSYENLLSIARTKTTISLSEIQAFSDWLPTGRVNQKQIDALRMLDEMQFPSQPAVAPVNFTFEYTNMWDEVVQSEKSYRPANFRP